MIAGHNGETIRGLDWRMSRRNGRVRTFTLNAKIGRDTPLIGEMRTRVTNGRPVLYFETNDAGALFRFTDIYPRMVGGRMWLGMDPPAQDAAPQEGIINVSSFSIRGEGALDRVVAGQPNGVQRTDNIEFSQARADFTRVPGRMTIRDGVLRGPILGATVEGNIDYARDQVNVRGTLVPLYGLNNMFGQIPIVGLFLGGGSNEGIFGITYEVSGLDRKPAAGGQSDLGDCAGHCCASSSSSAIAGARLHRPGAVNQPSETNVSSRFLRIAGSSTEASSSAATASRHALNGSRSSTSGAALRQHQRAAQILLHRRAEDEAEQQRRRLAAELVEDVAEQAEQRHQVHVERRCC